MSRQFEVLEGDAWCSSSPWFIGRWIVAVSGWLSADGQAKYGHSGIITDDKGKTLEALMRVKDRNIYDDFKGKHVVIARPVLNLDRKPILDSVKSVAVSIMIKEHLHKRYPWWRVPLNIIPPLARKLATKKYVVCSEMTAKYLWLVGSRHDQYPGTSPDRLSDEFHRWRQYEIVFEGTVE